jgi:hypothetical protein
MISRLALFLPAFVLALTSCEKAAAPKDEPPSKPAAAAALPAAPKVETPKESPEQLQKLQGTLPRMDPEKAKFIAVPSTPPDPKTEEKKSEEIKKADAAK